MNLDQITPVVLTYNEEPNFRRCLERLTWAERIVVIDSGSEDATADIAADFPNVDWFVRGFDDHTSQWNFGVEQVTTNWILAFDADYLMSDDLVEELRCLSDSSNSAWFASFRYLVFGKALRGSLYPARAVLFDRHRCRYVRDGHTQLLSVEGPTGKLSASIDHDDRKPLSRWLDSQRKYALLEADKLEEEKNPSGMPDRVRKRIWPAVPLTLIYTLFVKRAVFDGWAGWYYALQRTYAELLLSLVLLDRRLRGPRENSD